ncbi:MAG TPA: hemin uptake protein HemP [Burkholderiales bacterium]|nr:hemin uptake protein HemP [Burkholderiales bacterium]
MQTLDSSSDNPKPTAQADGARRAVPRVSSKDLMRNQSELIIEHDGREYRLRITHSGKLILTA